jgi:2,3-bisphosphoglycerate-independent phosphoglycerate mutase
LPEYDFVYAHIKGPIDEAAHDGDFKDKTRGIEAVDKKLEMFKKFGGILVVTCDHITSTEQKAHMPGPVPVLVYGRNKGKITTFDEFSVKKGKFKNYTPVKLLKFIFGKR